jgi:hypothetical protein
MAARFRAGKRLWTRKDEQLLRKLYPDTPTVDIAKRLGRSLAGTYQRARVLNLLKSAAYLASPEACRMRRGDDVGARFRFPKGNVPFNKGLRRPGWGPGRMKATQFKRGQRNGTAAALYMAVGSTRLIDGYVYRKVSDVPSVPYSVNWKPEHHLLWSEAHGAVPAGHAVRFKNGDRMDIRLDNLELVTRGAIMARNSVHNLPPELAQTVQLIGALTRQIRRREDHAREKQD